MSKLDILREELLSYQNVAIAFSSGVDSAFLLKEAHEVLKDKVLAITATSSFFPKREFEEARQFCKNYGIRQVVVEIDESEIEGFTSNPQNRCYICKKALFHRMLTVAAENGITTLAEGSNMDDLGDYRPGLVAIKELGIKSPLRAAGLTKSEIRQLSKEQGLPTWDKPSYACLASRFVYGETINKKKLNMVEQAEQFLMSKGFRQMRVRIHGDMARIELQASDMERFMKDDIRLVVYKQLKSLGFSYITLDLLGYRMGSMNETIL